ncbi:hypothetical protein CC80DRAFT_503084 [Byssothecium circinans]|uniref:Rhodopsin domain-containing protein n=1 Tax=Byssothecium circinans TaxID=147558 RepID=A0A6A5TZI8_9PLEO|nr:hypothetical protein CC80DRAFT_503084 [Byssothecium circinans]
MPSATMNTFAHQQFTPEYLAADNSARLFITCIAFLSIETIFICLLYTSRFLSGEPKKANLSMVVLMTGCYIVCLGKIAVGILSIKIGGAGRHTPTLTPTEITNSLKLNTTLQLVCPLTTSFSKLSILCLLHAILASTSRRSELVIRGTFIYVTTVAIIQLIIPLANCQPFAYNWDIHTPGRCAIDGLALWKYMSIPNVLSTLFIVCIPVPALWRLRVSPLTKAGLVVVLMVCGAGVVAAILRFLAFVRVENFSDFTYEEIEPMSWTVAESGIYMVAGVLPTLRPLVRRVFGGVQVDGLVSASFGGKRGKVVVKGEGSGTSENSMDKGGKGTVTEIEDEEKGYMGMR